MDIRCESYTRASNLPGATMPGAKIRTKYEMIYTEHQMIYMTLKGSREITIEEEEEEEKRAKRGSNISYHRRRGLRILRRI